MFEVMIYPVLPMVGTTLAFAALVYGFGGRRIYSPKIVRPVDQQATDVVRPLENVITNVKWPINY